MNKKILLLLLFAFGCKSLNTTENIMQPFTIHTIGDSTMANKPNPEKNPERGWGQMLSQFFDKRVTIENHAVNGRSTRSFRNLGHWKPVYDKLKKGDFVFIQFGHNDGKLTDSTRYTNPQTAYRHNLIRYVLETREKGATPILFTSIARRKFNEQGVLLDSHGNYTLVTRLVAQEYSVPIVDLQYYTELLEEKYGPEKSKLLHLHFPCGDPFFPDGKVDDTHLSVLGASEIAKIAVREVKKLKIEGISNTIIE